MKPILCVIGASATGKSTIVNRIRDKYDDIGVIVSHTTRNQRGGEKDGYDYYFVNKEEYDNLNKIEEVSYNSNKYCIAKKEIEEKLNNSAYSCLLVIVNDGGFEQIREKYDNVFSVYFFVPIWLVFIRLVKRGFFTGIKRFFHDLMRRRIKYWKTAFKYYDYVLINYKFTLQEVEDGMMKLINSLFLGGNKN